MPCRFPNLTDHEQHGLDGNGWSDGFASWTDDVRLAGLGFFLAGVSGAGSVLDLGNLTYLEGQTYYYESYIKALDGGQVKLDSLVSILDPSEGSTYYRAIHVLADGAGSRIDLSALQRFTDVDAYDDEPELASIESEGHRGRRDHAGEHQFAGRDMGLRRFHGRHGPLDGFGPAARAAGGRGEDLALPNLANLYDTDIVCNNALITAPLVTSFDRGDVYASSGGTISLVGVAAITRANLNASSGGTISLPAATLMKRSNLYASSGGTISFPALTAFDSLDTVFTWQATGPDSVIDLGGLEYLTGQTYQNESYIQALAGGRVNLDSLVSIVDPSNGSTYRRAIHVLADQAVPHRPRFAQQFMDTTAPRRARGGVSFRACDDQRWNDRCR